MSTVRLSLLLAQSAPIAVNPFERQIITTLSAWLVGRNGLGGRVGFWLLVRGFDGVLRASLGYGHSVEPHSEWSHGAVKLVR